MKPPKIFVIGSSRAGTSTLRTYFDEHPQLFVPEILEPRYHASDTRKALRGPGDEKMAAGMVASYDDYLDLFQECAPHQRSVEITPAYLSSRCAAESIRRTAPDAQIIAILRHPVERAFSSFRLERLEGTEPESDFSRALALEPQRRAAGWSYIWCYRERGFYGKHLMRYFQTFAPHQILVLLHDDWKRDGGRRLLAAISDFLGVESFESTGPTRVENSAPPERFRARGLTPPELDAATALKLRDSYRSDFDTLEKLIGRDLAAWREWSPPGFCA